MNSIADDSLLDERVELRRRLQAQRLLIAKRLGPPTPGSGANGGFSPRSATLRLLRDALKKETNRPNPKTKPGRVTTTKR